MKLLFVVGLLLLVCGHGLARLFPWTMEEIVEAWCEDRRPMRFFWFVVMMGLGAGSLVGAAFWWALS